MKKSRQKGFTLIELLISSFIFIIIIGGVINALLTSITLQERIIADQKMFAELSFTIEYMGRTLRMARKDVGGTCTEFRNHNYRIVGTSTIRFLNYNGECQEFSFIGSAINERIANSSSSSDLIILPFFPLTSTNVVVTSLVFNNAGSDWHSPSTSQSKVAIGLRVAPKMGDSEMRLQTVVSQRKLNFQF